MRKRIVTVATSLLVSWATLGATPAHAFLAANEDSQVAVKLLLSAKSEKITSYSAYKVHEYEVFRGVIRAHVSSNGQVFAYTGHNQMGHPPLALFGPYVKEYQDAVKAAHLKYGRRPLSVNTAHIRAGISGPQGSLNWYLYLQNLPAGVSRADIH